jgi:DNA polymerase III subunit epsilon
MGMYRELPQLRSFKTGTGQRMNFVVIDVETANPNFASICQIGIAPFRDGVLEQPQEWLVNPHDYFDPINVSIHGIDEDTVRAAPRWPEVYATVAPFLAGNIVASHTAFDHAAVRQACATWNVSACECRWLDTARVVRRAWPQFSKSGYGLANVAATFGIKYQAHDASEDARCAGEILMLAVEQTGLSVEQWLARVCQPIHATGDVPHANIEGPLFGEVLAFTGALSMPRHDAAVAAASAGCQVEAAVTKHTTLLVVGDQDIRRLAGHEKSSKHRKAEDLIKKGQRIRIVGESDFKGIIGQA